ncbi:MAG: tyrosine--tRNA ligase [Candidatus Moraniibacteriota bacterium]
MNIFKELSKRGFIAQCTNEIGVQKALQSPAVIYAGFDPTASSLHVGSLVPIMAMAHLQRAGHHILALVGGATAYIGDPSGKTDMRKMLTPEEIAVNIDGIRRQLSSFLSLDGTKGEVVNNADWFLPMGYIEFLREVGTYFRVNDMIRSESCRMRLEQESGLSFLEFNYQILQAWDFLHLARTKNCAIQLGGNDQWGNITAGVELVRRKNAREVYGLTFPLLTTASGKKMGKTEAGAVWLDASRTSPYEYYQYWINTEDKDVERFLKLYTFLSFEEVTSLCEHIGDDIDLLRNAKDVLAMETTAIAHGVLAAKQARDASRKLFSGDKDPSLADGAPKINIPFEELKKSDLVLVDLVYLSGLDMSKSDARRSIKQRGIYVEGEQVGGSLDQKIPFSQGTQILLRKGKKQYVLVNIV